MAAQISLEIVTPEGVQLSLLVDEFTGPSVDGEFGVLPGHRPLLAGLRTGIVSYRRGTDSSAVAIGPGFVKIEDDKAQLLTDNFIEKSDVDPIDARRDLKEAEETLAALASDAPDAEKLHAVKTARWAAIRLELYGDPPPPTVIIAHETRLLGHEDYAALARQKEDPAASGGADA